MLCNNFGRDVDDRTKFGDGMRSCNARLAFLMRFPLAETPLVGRVITVEERFGSRSTCCVSCAAASVCAWTAVLAKKPGELAIERQ